MVSKPDQHDFLVPLHVWEAAVFANADHFRVIRFENGTANYDSMKFTRWPDARRVAESIERVLIYAVTDRGRSCVLVRDRWNEFTMIWRKYHPKPRSKQNAQEETKPDRSTRRRTNKGTKA